MDSEFDASFFAPILRAELPFPLLFASVSGAHLYGFPSPDSDVDLRACHILPAASFLRLDEPRLTANRTWWADGVEVDLVSHDLKKFVTLLLRQNGNYLEQLFAPLVVVDTPWAAELRAIMHAGGIARHAYHAYALRGLQQALEDAYTASTLPDAPTNYAALDDFVLRVRTASAAPCA